MITELNLKNFKCFRDKVTIPLSQLNLLTGINGRGKSTALQALLLMRQSYEHNRNSQQVIFNGSCIELGSFNDVKNSLVSQEQQIEFSFKFDGDLVGNLHYFFKKNDADETVMDIDNINGNVMVSGETSRDNETGDVTILDDEEAIGSVDNMFGYDENKDDIVMRRRVFHWSIYESPSHYNMSWFNIIGPKSFDMFESNKPTTINFSKTHYISADRIGPQNFYLKQSFSEFPNVGKRGEYTANVLAHKRNEEVVYENLCLSTGTTQTLIDQTEAWLSQIFNGGKINIKPVDEANLVVMELNSESINHFYKPVNIGFGYSYALPIIVSGLMAQTGERLIVENPEAHLHPAAQSQMVKFLSRVSANGVQVFIESHSDHVLNGLRIAVLDQIISPEALNILYFDRQSTEHVVKIPVGADGSIENWPSGFFDQTDKDFRRLFGL